MTTYSPGAIANYFLKKAWDNDKAITPMKLQKLVYFAYGWATVYLTKPLIDEPIEAWEFGPVCSSIYHEFKQFGSSPIPKENFMSEIRFDDMFDDISDTNNGKSFLIPINTNTIKNDDIRSKELLDSVWKVYSKYDAKQLSEMSHRLDKDNPWIIAREKGKKEGVTRGKDIDQSDIKSYFKKIQKEKRLY